MRLGGAARDGVSVDGGRASWGGRPYTRKRCDELRRRRRWRWRPVAACDRHAPHGGLCDAPLLPQRQQMVAPSLRRRLARRAQLRGGVVDDALHHVIVRLPAVLELLKRESRLEHGVAAHGLLRREVPVARGRARGWRARRGVRAEPSVRPLCAWACEHNARMPWNASLRRGVYALEPGVARETCERGAGLWRAEVQDRGGGKGGGVHQSSRGMLTIA